MTATDIVGNTTTVTTGDIKVYSADTIVITYDDLSDLHIKKTSHGEEYNASAVDSFGDPCTVTLVLSDGSALTGGVVSNVKIIATDFLGNVLESASIENAKIYDAPRLVFAHDSYYISSSENPLELFTLLDSFDEELEISIEVVDALSTEYVTVCHITGHDIVGNAYDQNISLDIVDTDEVVIHVFINGVEITTLRANDIDHYDLPRYTGYTTTWLVNDEDFGNDVDAVVSLPIDGNVTSIRAYGTKVANEYAVSLDGIKNVAVVSFNLNGGTGLVPSQQVDDETALVYPNIPTKEGFIFGGWYDKVPDTRGTNA